MITKDGNKNFDACLKSENGEILATGQASINVHRKHVTFKSGFVPLYPMGTPMEIVRLLDGVEIHRFIGKVYLSDKKLIRIVSVDDELLPGSEYCYCDKFSFAAMVQPCFEYMNNDKWQFKKNRKSDFSGSDFPIEIVGMTVNQVVFKFHEAPRIAVKHTLLKEYNTIADTMLGVKIGHRFILNMNEPILLENVEIAVEKPLYFGQAPCYVCDIVNLDPVEYRLLGTFLWNYNLQRNKLF